MKDTRCKITDVAGTIGSLLYRAYLQQSILATPAERPPGHHGTLLIGKMEGVMNRLRNFRGSRISLSPFYLRRPSKAASSIYHFRDGRRALMANPAERPRNPTEPHGKPRNGKIGKLRLESGILWIPGSAFCFSLFAAHPRWFRLFRISALGFGC